MIAEGPTSQLEQDIADRSNAVEGKVRNRLAMAIAGVSRKPEGDFAEDGIWYPHQRENVERVTYGKLDYQGADPMAYRRQKIWGSAAHCLKLVEAFFAGLDVPHDVADVCRNRHERYREEELRKAVDRAIDTENERRRALRMRQDEEAWAEEQVREAAYVASPEGKLEEALEHKADLERKIENARKKFEKYEASIQTRITRVNRQIGALKARIK